MSYDYTLQKRIEFSETDSAGLLHFSNFFRFMEMAEHAWLRSVNIEVMTDGIETRRGWPKVHAECDYHQPVYYGDLIQINLTIVKKTLRTIHYQFCFIKTNISPHLEVATGKLIVAYVIWEGRSNQLQAIPIPEEITLIISGIKK
jgi:YbgC/YbaW family acyl-CoA thioester hydrolase